MGNVIHSSPKARWVTFEKLRDEAWTVYTRELGLNLHRARVASGVSQERLAHKAGISTNQYQKYEKGHSRPGTPMNPQLSTILALSQALGVGLTELLPVNTPDLTVGR